MGSNLIRANASFASSIAQGLHCLGVTPELDRLPADMVHAADHSLYLPTLSGAAVRALAALMCGGRSTVPIPDEEAARLTPRLLRLARRPGQTADDYLLKLAALLERDSKTSERVQQQSSPPKSPRAAPTLERLHGMDEAVAWGRNLVRDLAAFRAGTLVWADVDRGCLLSGPPGCGKTLFARALSASCGVPLITGSYGEWHGSGGAHQGDLLKSMRRTFADARAKAPSILFIDEVDSFPNRSTVAHSHADWEIQVVNALLTEIDGVEVREGVVLVAACNHPEMLDPALVRSGRLDRHIRIHLPDQAALARILREHLGAEAEGWDLSRAALLAAGSSGADCERYVRGARRRVRLANRSMQVHDLEAEVDSTSQSEAETRLAAIHEAGHATAAFELLGAVEAVSLRMTRLSGGSTRTSVASNYLTADDILRQIVVALAGRAAEEVILGVPSSASGGAVGSDLARATALAAMAVAALGFDPDLGLAWRGMPDLRSLKDIMAASGVRASVSRLIRQAYDMALELATKQQKAIEILAIELIAVRALDGAAVTRLLEGTLTQNAKLFQFERGRDVLSRPCPT